MIVHYAYVPPVPNRDVMQIFARTAATALTRIVRTVHVSAVMDVLAAPPDAPVLYARTVMVVMNPVVSEAHVLAVMEPDPAVPAHAPVQYVTTAAVALKSVRKEVHVYAVTPDPVVVTVYYVPNVKNVANAETVYAARNPVATVIYVPDAINAPSTAAPKDGVDAAMDQDREDPTLAPDHYVIFVINAKSPDAPMNYVNVMDVTSPAATV